MTVVIYAKKHGKDASEQLELALDKLFVNFGLEILKIVPGRVSTEVDARLSFDTEATIAKAHTLVKLYNDAGIMTLCYLFETPLNNIY